jgi:hypothetical protein
MVPTRGRPNPIPPGPRITISRRKTCSQSQARSISHSGRRPVLGRTNIRIVGGQRLPSRPTHWQDQFPPPATVPSLRKVRPPTTSRQTCTHPTSQSRFSRHPSLPQDIRTSPETQTIADMICIAFVFLRRPGEYTCGTGNTPFRLKDAAVYIGTQQLNSRSASPEEFAKVTFASLTFTAQKMESRAKPFPMHSAVIP